MCHGHLRNNKGSVSFFVSGLLKYTCHYIHSSPGVYLITEQFEWQKSCFLQTVYLYICFTLPNFCVKQLIGCRLFIDIREVEGKETVIGSIICQQTTTNEQTIICQVQLSFFFGCCFFLRLFVPACMDLTSKRCWMPFRAPFVQYVCMYIPDTLGS